MKQPKLITFISLLLFATIPISVFAQQKQMKEKSPETELTVTLYKTLGCQCCSKWATYMEENGFSVREMPSDTLANVKNHYNVPKNLRSCHTALIDGYVVEGHVTVQSIRKLLKTRPDAQGIAVPGMPDGSPGMGKDGPPYKVFLFDDQAKKSVYGKY